jgi:putative flippase GtrA
VRRSVTGAFALLLQGRSPLMIWSRRLAIFAGVGLVATATHGLVAWALIGSLHALAANAIGFTIALGVTYAGNYFLTFRSAAAHGEALIRFLVVSAVTLGISEWALVFLDAMNAPETPSIVLAVAVVPLLRFGVLATHVFDGRKHQAVPLGPWLVEVGVWVGAACFGLVALVAMAPDGLLDATSDLWYLPGGDRGIGVAGMRYYLADDWHWPLLLTDDLNTPDGTVIAFTDSLPILALPAKLARPLLGTDVNYFPSWYLLTYTLQGVGAVALLRSLRVRRPEALLAGAALAVTFPAFAFRSFHPALSGQFIVLLTLAAAFASAEPDRREAPAGDGDGDEPPPVATRRFGGRYRALSGAGLVAAMLIHPYLMFMTAPLVAGIYLDHWRRQRLAFRQLASTGAATMAALGVTLAAGGYLGDYELTSDYGGFGLNLLSPVYPQLSAVVPGDNPVLAVGGSWEGFNWLGVGALLLVGAALVIARHRLGGLVMRWQALALACLAVTALAVTHRVTYGHNGLLNLEPLLLSLHDRRWLVAPAVALVLGVCAALLWRWRWMPSWLAVAVAATPVFVIGLVVVAGGRLATTMSPVRASGRLWWSVGLLVTLGSVALVAKARARTAAAVVLAAAVLVQVVDTGPVRSGAGLAVTETIAIPGAARLVDAAAAADQVRVWPSFFCAPYPEGAFAVLGTVVVASAAGVTPVDTVYTARRPSGVDCTAAPYDSLASNDLLVLVLPARRDPGPLLTADHRCRDDGQVLACSPMWAGLAVSATAPFRPVVAEPVTFGQGGDAETVMTSGWGDAEPWGRVIPPGGAGLEIPLVGTSETVGTGAGDGRLTIRLRLRSITGEPATVVVTSGGGAEQRVTVGGQGQENFEVTIEPPAGDRLELQLASSPSGPAAGIDELTVLLDA